MEGSPRETRIYYRCSARTLVPGSPILADHPKNVYLPEIMVLDQLNGWIGHVFSPQQRETTVRQILGVVGTAPSDSARLEAARRKVSEAGTRLRRLQQAIEAGASPAALVDPINRAKEEQDAAREELESLPASTNASRAEIEAMIDYFGDLGGPFSRADPIELQKLYEDLGLEMVYNAEERTVDVTVRPPRRVNVCV